MTAEELLQENTFEKILSLENDIERVTEINRLRDIAKKHNMLKNFNDVLRLKEKRNKKVKKALIFPKTNEYGNPKNLQVNVWRLMEHYNITVRYNELKKEIDIKMEDSDLITHDNKNEILEESIYDKCIEHDFTGLSKDRLSSMLLTFADIGKFNPITDYLNSLTPLRGTRHLDSLCETLATDNFDEDFKKVLVKTWLISCVAAAFSEKGLSAHGVLVLQGEQGIGKTTWFRRIVPNPDWFKDGITLDVRNKDTIMKIVKYWITELGEIGSTVKKDFDALKAFLTQDGDELRRAYARKESMYPRRTIFCGSVNQNEYLMDDTGNRRFWTIPVTDINYKHSVDIDAVWSEILHMYYNNEPYYLSREQQQQLNECNSNHNVFDYTDTLLESAFKWDSQERYLLTSADVFKELCNPVGITLTKISRSLTKRGMTVFRKSKGRFWKMPILKSEPINWQYDKIDVEWDEIV